MARFLKRRRLADILQSVNQGKETAGRRRYKTHQMLFMIEDH